MTDKGHQLNIFDLFAMEEEADHVTVVAQEQTDNDSAVDDDISSLVQSAGDAKVSDKSVNEEESAVGAIPSTQAVEDVEEKTTPAPTSNSPATQAASSGKGSSNKKSATSKKSAAAAKGGTTTPAKPTITQVELGGDKDWKVRYAGTTYHLNLLFEEEITDGKTIVTLEEIREKLVTTEFCIELSPQRAYWEAEEDQQLLILICKGQSKGGF